MREIGRYDSALQMFVEKPKPIKLGTLMFHRFLAEKAGRTISPPRGDLALAGAIISEPKPAKSTRRTIVQGD